MIRPLLLHLANSDPPNARREFYDLKSRLLHKHGTRDGYDLQEIVKPCWGPWDNRYGDYAGCKKALTCRCGGTGIFSRRLIGLERWRWGRFRFHIPMESGNLPCRLITIHGRIEHKRYGRVSDEAAIWLFLLCGMFVAAWREATGSYRYGRYAWPLLTLGRIIFPIKHRLTMRRCHCGRWYFPNRGYSYWCACQRCATRTSFDDVPF